MRPEFSDIREIDTLAKQWRAEEDVLVEGQRVKLRHLHETRKAAEINISIDILKKVHNLGMSSLNKNFEKLENLVAGLPRDDESSKPKEGVKVSLSYYYAATEKIHDTEASLFMKYMVGTLISPFNNSDKIIIGHVGTVGLESDKNFLGHLMLCDGYGKYSNYLSADFNVYNNVYNNENIGPLNISVNKNEASGAKSLEEMFGHLLLSEKAMVVAALFVATDNAITDGLKAYPKRK